MPYGLMAIVKAIRLPANISRPAFMARNAEVAMTANHTFTCPRSSSRAKNFPRTTITITASSVVGFRRSGSSLTLIATSRTNRATELATHTPLATGNGMTLSGIVSTAKAGRYLNW